MTGKPTSLRILNLGAGVQSTAVYLLALDGEIPSFDCAIFADTQEEPQAVYSHLEWLQSLGGPEIRVVSRGKLGDDLIAGVGERRWFSQIPAFTEAEMSDGDGDQVASSRWRTLVSKGKRHCSSDYKIQPIERSIRRDILGLKPRQRMPAGTCITQVFGISLDEARRAVAIQKRVRVQSWSGEPEFPLIDRNWTRGHCIKYLKGRVPHEVPRSACVFCPFHNDMEWQRIKTEDQEGWQRAVEVDRALRDAGSACTRGRRRDAYLHRSLQPLSEVDFDAKGAMLPGMTFECEGMCGN